MNKSISAAKAVHKIVFPHYAITMQIELGSLCAAGFPFSFSFFQLEFFMSDGPLVN